MSPAGKGLDFQVVVKLINSDFEGSSLEEWNKIKYVKPQVFLKKDFLLYLELLFHLDFKCLI